MRPPRTPTRRSFLRATAAALSAPILLGPRRAAAASPLDLSFGSALEIVRAIRGGTVSSREVVEHTFRRIHRYEPKVHAFLTLAEPQALERARRADEAAALGEFWGPLHGLPVVVKDTFATAGLRTTCGSKQLENHVPREDAAAVGRLRAAGAVIIGKTNMPEFAADMQSYNALTEAACNPWDLSRTPGGSTGGGAAAVAAGLGFLELGSDIGGSIRVPAHFCGVYGHKPSLGLVPMEGHIPPLPDVPLLPPDLMVGGPLARDATDLRLELEVLAGRLAGPRGSRLRDYRVGFVLDDPFCPVSPEVKGPLAAAVEALRKAGLEPVEGWPAGVSQQAAFGTYLPLLAANVALADSDLEQMRASQGLSWGYYARKWLEGSGLAHRAWLGLSAERLRFRDTLQRWFREFDVLLLPTSFVPAFQHQHQGSFFERTLDTSLGRRQYGDLLRWIVIGSLSGCPVTVAPVGRTREGLPVGMQIVGPYLEDATPIDFAARLADLTGGFEEPPGFRD